MMTVKKINYPVHKASKIKKSVWVTKCVAGSSATEHWAHSLMRDLSVESDLGQQCGLPQEGFGQQSGGAGDRCGAV